MAEAGRFETATSSSNMDVELWRVKKLIQSLDNARG